MSGQPRRRPEDGQQYRPPVRQRSGGNAYANPGSVGGRYQQQPQGPYAQYAQPGYGRYAQASQNTSYAQLGYGQLSTYNPNAQQGYDTAATSASPYATPGNAPYHGSFVASSQAYYPHPSAVINRPATAYDSPYSARTYTGMPVPELPHETRSDSNTASENISAYMSRQELIEILEIPRDWIKKCRRAAVEFGADCSADHHMRVQAVFQVDRFKSWIQQRDSKALILQDETSTQCERDPDCDCEGGFSILSHYVASLANWFPTHCSSIPIVFFCGKYDGKDGQRFNDVNIAILRSLCSQLLGHKQIKHGILKDISFNARDRREVERGDLDQLRKLFEDLVMGFSLDTSTILCFIDGIHRLENYEHGRSEFVKICRSFKRLSECENIRFKLMLTYAEPWDRDFARALGRMLTREVAFESAQGPQMRQEPPSVVKVPEEASGVVRGEPPRVVLDKNPGGKVSNEILKKLLPTPH